MVNTIQSQSTSNNTIIKSDSSQMVPENSSGGTTTNFGNPSESTASTDQPSSTAATSTTPPPSFKLNHIGPLANTNETRIVYHVDDEETPYLVKLPIPHSNIKLSDFKAAISLPRPHYKFFFKSFDKEIGVVKEEIIDDNASLPIFKDRVVAWLVSTEGSTVSDSTNSQCQTEISATGRIHPAHRYAHERNGLIGDSYPPSFHGDHCVQTTETESMMSSRNGANHSNSRRSYNNHHHYHHHHKSGHHSPKYNNRYHGNGGSGYYSGYHDHHHYMDSSVLTSDMESTSFVDSDDDDDDLLDTVDDDNDYEDYTSRISTTTEETSVSRQYNRRNRRRRLKGSGCRNRMSRTSSLSSITESSMPINIIQVTLNLDTASYLGISLVGKTSKKGDGGIYVNSILNGGAVALDGRIEPGDMILQVNDINLVDMSNDEAVEVIREAVKKPGPIKLLVAKCWNLHPRGHFTIPRSEPVRPIDPGAWVAHTEAARAKFTHPDNCPMNLPPASEFLVNPSSISASFPDPERPNMFQQTTFTPTDASYPLPASNIDTSSLVPRSPLRGSFKSGHSSVPVSAGSRQASFIEMTAQRPSAAGLTLESDLETIACAMARPNSGLDVRDRMWLKISIPNAFIGSDVVNWLNEALPGRDRKEAKKLASKLLKEGYICHTINLKSSFSEKCYYIFSEQLQQINKSSTATAETDFTGSVVSQPLPNHQFSKDWDFSTPGNFDEKFSNALRLKNDHFENSNLSEQVLSNYDATGISTQNKTRSKLPFMYHWDENSEIRNYGLFGPQPENNQNRNDGNNSNHSGGNRSHQDQYQSDEQMSQKSAQSIFFNPNARTASQITSGAVPPTNTLKSSGSSGKNVSNGGSSNNGVGGNLINHHYEDLQMNPITGNLVPTSIVNNNNDPTAVAAAAAAAAVPGIGSTFRHVEGNEALTIDHSKTGKNVEHDNIHQQKQEGYTHKDSHYHRSSTSDEVVGSIGKVAATALLSSSSLQSPLVVVANDKNNRKNNFHVFLSDSSQHNHHVDYCEPINTP